jgi:hypothetical protein
MDIIPCSHFSRVHDEEMAQAVFREAERMQQEKMNAALRTWNAMAHDCQRGIRLPDGTHCSFRIPKIAYHHWGSRYGYECWEDNGFVAEFLRDNPQCRVKSEALSPTILSGWVPSTPLSKAYRRDTGREAA